MTISIVLDFFLAQKLILVTRDFSLRNQRKNERKKSVYTKNYFGNHPNTIYITNGNKKESHEQCNHEETAYCTYESCVTSWGKLPHPRSDIPER